MLISGCLIGAREVLRELGVDADAVARRAGLPVRAFDDPALYVLAERIIEYFELAAEVSGREDFGLLHAHRLPLGMLGQGWMLMRAAATVGEALRDFVSLYGLYTDAGSLLATRDGGDLWLQSSFLPVGDFGSSQSVYLTLATICLFVRANLSPRWQPRRAELRSTPRDPAPFKAFFGPSVGFGCNRDAILIGAETLSAPMGSGAERRTLHKALRDQTACPGVGVVAQVRALLGVFLRGDSSSIDMVCKALLIGPRSLQRRLAAAGTTYRKLQEEVRADLAWRHVKRSELSVQRIAELLGYESAAAFSRAFRRWYGSSPRAVRRS